MYSRLFTVCLLSVALFSNTTYCFNQEFECPTTLSGHKCSRIAVPLDHSKPNNSLLIPILYAVATPHPSIAAPPFRHALLHIPGGPGGGSLNDNPQLFATSDNANLLKRPIVVIDPRGTGNASLIDCSLQQTSTSFDYNLREVTHCMKEIGRHHALHYSVRAIASDVDLIRKELGYEQLDVFGISYGALISQVYAIMFPTYTRSLILDSPVPLNYSDIYETRNMRAMLRIHTLFAQDESLNFTQRKTNTYLEILIRRLRWKKYREENANGLTVRQLFQIYRRPNVGFVRAMQTAVDSHDFQPLLQIAKTRGVLSPLPPINVAYGSRSMGIATKCNSNIFYLPWKAKSRNIRSRYMKWKADLKKKTKNAYKPFRSMEAFPRYTRACTAFPFAHLPSEALPKSDSPLPEIPALVLYGDRDAGTPLEEIPILHSALQHKVAVVKGAGHVLALHACGLRLIVEFAQTQNNINLSACE